ncbi:MAG: ATP-dependent DNA helicase [Acidilobaceae archaeon]
MDSIFPYSSFRRGQRELAEAVSSTVRSGGVLIIKAPTGYGKTAAVIYGLLLGGAERVLYAVRTVNEIDPVIRELRLFKARLTFLFSARRSCPLMYKPSQPPLSHEDFWSNCAILRIRRLCKYYMSLGSVNGGDVERFISNYPLPHAVRISIDLAKYFGICPFFTLLSRVSDSQFIITTYPYVFRKDIFSEVFPEFSYRDFIIVVDEAHSLLGAHSMLESRVTIQDIQSSIQEIKKYVSSGDSVAEILEDLVRDLGEYRRFKWKGFRVIDKFRILKVLGDPKILADIERVIRERLILEALVSGNIRVSLALSKVVRWAQTLVDQNYTLFAIREGDDITLVSTPLDPALTVKDPLSEAKAVIMLSGTIPPGDFLGVHLGVKRESTSVDIELLYGPVMPKSNIYTIVASDVTTRYVERNVLTYSKIAEYIVEIARALEGVKLVVYPSYEVMNSIVERVPKDLNIIIEGPGTSLGEVEASIMEEKNLLVNAVAGGKLVEGVEFIDYEGENVLHTVIVVGLPFPQPDDYTKKHLEVLLNRMKEKDARELVYLISTIIRVKQALGRAIRSPEDKAVYILLDYRYLRRDIKELLQLKYNDVVTSIVDFRRKLATLRKHLEEDKTSPTTNT